MNTKENQNDRFDLLAENDKLRDEVIELCQQCRELELQADTWVATAGRREDENDRLEQRCRELEAALSRVKNCNDLCTAQEYAECVLRSSPPPPVPTCKYAKDCIAKLTMEYTDGTLGEAVPPTKGADK